jgi:hypothetical protein
MNAKNQIKAIAALVTLMSTTAISGAAYAEDGKVYSGSQCDLAALSSSNIGSLSRFGGQILNRSTSSVEVICPVVRDIVGGTDNGSTGPKAVVHVFSNNATFSTLECDLRAFEVNKLGPTSGRFQRLSRALGGGIPGNPAKFAFNFNGPIQQTPSGAYEIRCTLPANTGIGNYTVIE